MQFVHLKMKSGGFVLLDVKEIATLDAVEAKGEDLGDYAMDHEPDDTNLNMVIVYGLYMPQAKSEATLEKKKEEMQGALNKWLVHLDGDNSVFVGIEAIKPYDKPLHGGCGHDNVKRELPMVAFSALIGVPPNYDFGSVETHAKTAFLRYFDQMSLVENVFNRHGVFAFKVQEKRVPEDVELSVDNWLEYVDDDRAYAAAQKTR